MIICVVTGREINEIDALPECDIAVMGFKSLGEVDYECELKGSTDKFEDAARLSKNYACAVACGCRTLSRGVVRKSVAVADRGRLLGISDMNHVLDCENFKSGAGLGLYTVGGYKIGLCIENDLLFPEDVKSLALCGCNLIVAVLEELKDNVPPLLARAYSYLFGVPMIMCAGNTACLTQTSGAIATSTQPYATFEVSPQNRYRLVTSRIKGLTHESPPDY